MAGQDGRLMASRFPARQLFPVEFIRHVRNGDVACVRLERGNPASVGPLGYFGDLIHYDLPNEHVIYRLGEYDAVANAVHGAWPD